MSGACSIMQKSTSDQHSIAPTSISKQLPRYTNRPCTSGARPGKIHRILRLSDGLILTQSHFFSVKFYSSAHYVQWIPPNWDALFFSYRRARSRIFFQIYYFIEFLPKKSHKNGQKIGPKGRFALFILKARAYSWFL